MFLEMYNRIIDLTEDAPELVSLMREVSENTRQLRADGFRER